MDRKHRWDAHPSTLTISRCGVSHYQGTCASDEVVPFLQRVGPWFPTVNIILQGHFLGVSYPFLGQVYHELPCIFGTSSMLQAGEIQGEDGVARAYRPSWNGRCLWHWVKKTSESSSWSWAIYNFALQVMWFPCVFFVWWGLSNLQGVCSAL